MIKLQSKRIQNTSSMVTERMVKLLELESIITALRITEENATATKRAIASRVRELKKAFEDYGVMHFNLLSKIGREHAAYQDLVNQHEEVK